MRQPTSIYDKTVHVTETYLGPAGERFIRRQISTHLGIEPEKLGQEDLPKLIEWASVAFAMLTDNRNDVDTFTQNLSSLIDRRN